MSGKIREAFEIFGAVKTDSFEFTFSGGFELFTREGGDTFLFR